MTEPEVTQYISDQTAVGSSLTSAEISALDALVVGLKNDGIWSKLLHVSCFRGTNLAGKLLKLKHTVGEGLSWTTVGSWATSSYWTGQGITNGTSTTEYLTSGFVPAAEGLSETNFSGGFFQINTTLNFATTSSSFWGPLAPSVNGPQLGSKGSGTAVNYTVTSPPGIQALSLIAGATRVLDGFSRAKKDVNLNSTASATMALECALFAGYAGTAVNRVGLGRIGFNFFGSTLTYAEMQQLASRINTFLVAIGAFVGWAGSFAAIGDSIAFGNGLASATFQTQRWPYLVSQVLGRAEGNLGLNSGFLSYDFTSSPYTRSGINRYTDLALFTPAIVAMSLGLNDCRTKDTTVGGWDPALVAICQANTETIITYLKSTLGLSNRHIAIMGIPYWNDAHYDATRVGGWIAGQQAAVAAAGGTFVDIWTAMVDNGGDALLAGDLLHPNAAGHQVIANAVLAAISADVFPASQMMMVNP